MNVVVAAEIDDLAIEVEVDGLRRRVGREVEDDRERGRDAVLHRFLQFARKSKPGRSGHGAASAAPMSSPGMKRRTARRKKARWDS